MYLPSGPEKTTIRRAPIVTFGIMAVMVIIFLLQYRWQPPKLTALKNAVHFRAAHVYLNAPQRLDNIVKNRYPGALDRRMQKPDVDLILAQEQAKMDSLVLLGFKVLDDQYTTRWGLIPREPLWPGLVTHIFLSGGLFSLLVSLFFLYISGPYMEDIWGRPFFALLFFVGGAGSGLGLTLIYPETWRALSGASGAVATVMGAYTVHFYKERIRFLVLIPGSTKDQVFVKPIYFFPSSLLLIFLIQVISHAISDEREAFLPATANFFGFAIGVTVSWLLGIFNLGAKLYKSPFEKLPLEEQIEIRVNEALKEHRIDDAFVALLQGYRDCPENTSFQEQLWHQSVRSNRVDQVPSVGKVLIRRLITEGQYVDAYQQWYIFSEKLPNERIPVSQIADLAHGLLAVGHREQASDLLRTSLSQTGKGVSLHSLRKLVEVANFVDPRVCLTGIKTLLTKPSLGQQERADLEELRRETLLLYPRADEPELLNVIELAAPDPNHGLPVENPFTSTCISSLQIHRGTPLQLTDAGLIFQSPNGKSKTIAFPQIQGLAAAAIRPLGSQPFLLVDLLADEPYQEKKSHSLLRLDNRGFDPRNLVEDPRPLEAMRRFLQLLLDRSGATPLPDRSRLMGTQFASYCSIAEYEESVYGVSSG